jgi:hypothetical protein
MIKEKTIEIAEKANKDYLKENEIYTAKEVKYGYTQKVIELTLKEVEKAIEKADLRDKTYTTYDRDNMKFCKDQIKKEIESLLNEI